MYDIPAIIFAGGKSSRMGTDKALLPFKDKETLSHFQYEKLTSLFSHVYLSSKKNKFPFECLVIKDIYPQSSPLVGLLSLFETLTCEAVFILSVDAPLIDKKIIDILMHAYKTNPSYDVIIAKSPKGLQPLCGIYRRSIIPLATQRYEQQAYALMPLLKTAHTLIVSFEEELPFSNLNTPQEYQAIFSFQ